jgi:hypothetical protein
VHWGQLNTLTSAAVRQAFPALPHWQRELADIAGDGETFDNSFCRERDLKPNG